MANPSKPSRQSAREKRASRRRQQRNLIIAVMVIGGGALILLLALPSIIDALRPAGEVVIPEGTVYEQVDFNTMGDPNAPVVIVEYSDFQCPYCKRFSDETEPSLIENYVNTGKVLLVYTPYGPGGRFIGPESEYAAHAAFCAAEQGKFWEYKEIIFANHTGENVGDYTEKKLIAFAEELNLDMQQFNECFNSRKYEQLINEGIARGRANAVGGTPTFIFNDGVEVLEGAFPINSFVDVIERLTAE